MEILDKDITKKQVAALSRSELISLAWTGHELLKELQSELADYQSKNEQLEKKSGQMAEVMENLLTRLYGKSSEKSQKEDPPLDDSGKNIGAQGNSKNKRKRSCKLPSERYPNAPIVDQMLPFEDAPICNGCGEAMQSTGLSEVSEQLSSKPREIFILRFHRPKYRCKCCESSFATPPLPARMLPGSSYSDDFIIDVALSKYCDLIPIGRFCSMAARQGVTGLPAQSLIELTHVLASFVLEAAKQIARSIMKARVLHADETTHRMLEGHEKSNWYLWGFSTDNQVVFELQPTRSGEIASEILTESSCEVLVSDVFSGYAKAVKSINKEREAESEQDGAKRPPVISSYCNAHARRKFVESSRNFGQQSEFYTEKYGAIYTIEKQVKAAPEADTKRLLRLSMHPLFQDMKYQAEQDLAGVSKHSALGKALRYFLNNYENLIIPVWDHEVSLDNNSQERTFRNPVIGRKTWYGTHSVRGAQTASVLLTLVESCKMCHVNPREYFQTLVNSLHNGGPPIAPLEFSNLQTSPTPLH